MSNPPKGRGVLPINAAATRKSNKSTPRPPATKLRLIIRRLPPGLTESEFWDAIGSEWQLGNGKVDWAAFKPGKVSKDLAKPSRPARAYLKVKEQGSLEPLSAKIRQTTFQDAKNTSKDSCLVGPPSLEFAPYNKVPSNRARNDGRQGTIDQDPEFIDFLQTLTEPITRPATNGADSADARDKKATTTPLIQYLKEKKANKAKDKEAAASKASKKGHESKEAKSAAGGKAEARSKVVKSTSATTDKARVQKATEEAVKAVNRSVSLLTTKQGSTATEPKSTSKETTNVTQPVPKRERQRGDASVAARMVARDLGLVPKEGKSGRATKGITGTSEPPPKTKPAQTTVLSSQTVATDSPKSTTHPPASPITGSVQPPTGPRNSHQNTPPSKQSSQPASQKPSKTAAQPSANAKSAFLKHANPSQGVTEALLRTTFEVFGTITRCEIDKKKGLGYVDFAETGALKKAMMASPVKVGKGQVVVLENRSPYKKGDQHQRENPAPPRSPSIASPAVSAVSSPKPTAAKAVSLQTADDANDASVATSTTSAVDAVASPGLDSKSETGITATTNPGGTPATSRGGRGARSNHRGGRGGPRGRGRGGRGGGGANPTEAQTLSDATTPATTAPPVNTT